MVLWINIIALNSAPIDQFDGCLGHHTSITDGFIKIIAGHSTPTVAAESPTHSRLTVLLVPDQQLKRLIVSCAHPKTSDAGIIHRRKISPIQARAVALASAQVSPFEYKLLCALRAARSLPLGLTTRVLQYE